MLTLGRRKRGDSSVVDSTPGCSFSQKGERSPQAPLHHIADLLSRESHSPFWNVLSAKDAPAPDHLWPLKGSTPSRRGQSGGRLQGLLPSRLPARPLAQGQRVSLSRPGRTVTPPRLLRASASFPFRDAYMEHEGGGGGHLTRSWVAEDRAHFGYQPTGIGQSLGSLPDFGDPPPVLSASWTRRATQEVINRGQSSEATVPPVFHPLQRILLLVVAAAADGRMRALEAESQGKGQEIARLQELVKAREHALSLVRRELGPLWDRQLDASAEGIDRQAPSWASPETATPSWITTGEEAAAIHPAGLAACVATILRNSGQGAATEPAGDSLPLAGGAQGAPSSADIDALSLAVMRAFSVVIQKARALAEEDQAAGHVYHDSTRRSLPPPRRASAVELEEAVHAAAGAVERLKATVEMCWKAARSSPAVARTGQTDSMAQRGAQGDSGARCVRRRSISADFVDWNPESAGVGVGMGGAGRAQDVRESLRSLQPLSEGELAEARRLSIGSHWSAATARPSRVSEARCSTAYSSPPSSEIAVAVSRAVGNALDRISLRASRDSSVVAPLPFTDPEANLTLSWGGGPAQADSGSRRHSIGAYSPAPPPLPFSESPAALGNGSAAREEVWGEGGGEGGGDGTPDSIVEQLLAELEKAAAKVAGMEQQMAEMQADLDWSRQECGQMEAALHQAQEKSDQMQGDVAELQRELQLKDAAVAELSRTRQLLLQAKREELSAMRALCLQREEELAMAEAASEAAKEAGQQRHAALEEICRGRDVTITLLRTRIAGLEAHMNHQLAEVQRLQALLDARRLDASATTTTATWGHPRALQLQPAAPSLAPSPPASAPPPSLSPAALGAAQRSSRLHLASAQPSPGHHQRGDQLLALLAAEESFEALSLGSGSPSSQHADEDLSCQPGTPEDSFPPLPLSSDGTSAGPTPTAEPPSPSPAAPSHGHHRRSSRGSGDQFTTPSPTGPSSKREAERGDLSGGGRHSAARGVERQRSKRERSDPSKGSGGSGTSSGASAWGWASGSGSRSRSGGSGSKDSRHRLSSGGTSGGGGSSGGGGGGRAGSVLRERNHAAASARRRSLGGQEFKPGMWVMMLPRRSNENDKPR